jgi:hypothetical protein
MMFLSHPNCEKSYFGHGHRSLPVNEKMTGTWLLFWVNDSERNAERTIDVSVNDRLGLTSHVIEHKL